MRAPVGNSPTPALHETLLKSVQSGVLLLNYSLVDALCPLCRSNAKCPELFPTDGQMTYMGMCNSWQTTQNKPGRLSPLPSKPRRRRQECGDG